MAKTPILTKDGLVRYDENIKEYIDTGLENKVSKTDIVNNLVSTDVDAPLSAMQGKILKDTIDRLEVPGAVIYRGTIGIDGDITELPSTYKRGDMYCVATEGTYSEQECEVGDFLFCTRDNILTVATLPDYNTNSFPMYIMYQKYNPQTGANGEIIFAALKTSGMGSDYLNRICYDIQDGTKKIYLSNMFYVKFCSTVNNGVTWTDFTSVNGEPYYVLFTETETEAIRILNSNVEIYNNENAIIYSPNPWGLSGYATDWAVIQGNLEDTIGEGAIYIDPDETSSEIENVDSVTSAKYVSYSNANSGLEATNVQEAIDEVNKKTDDINTYLQRDAKNKLNLSFYTNSTGQGVSWVLNENQTISLSGTQTNFSMGDYYIGEAYLKAGIEYILTGCPNGGSNSTYRLKVHNKENTAECSVDIGEGVTFTVDTDGTYKISTSFILGVNYDGIVLKPMIREASIEDDTYEPYRYQDAMSIVNNALVHRDVVDHLNSTATDLPLSAKQGKILSDRIAGHLMYGWTYYVQNGNVPDPIYIKDFGSLGHQFFRGVVIAQNIGGSSPAAVLLGIGENNTYWGLGYTIPLISNGCITVDRVALSNYIYLKITPTASCMINLLLDKQFQYYIGTDPTASDAVWTTVK